jgi:hypothetical protein
MNDSERDSRRIHVSGSREQKGVRLYGKSDYYLICTEKLVRSCGVVIRVYLSKRRVVRPMSSLSG